jgi:hypothetical protein
VELADGKPLSAAQEALVEAARAGDLEGVRSALTDGADADALGFHFAAAVQSALDTGDATWLKRTCKRVLRPAEPPHPNETRARALATSLGEVDFASTSRAMDDQRPVAWGFHVGPGLATGTALAIGASVGSPVIVLVRSTPERARAYTVVAKTLARAPQLWAGACIGPPTGAYGDDSFPDLPARWKIADPRASFPDLACEDALVATPVPHRTIAQQARRETLENRVSRLGKLIELNAPDQIIEEERFRIGQGLVALIDSGWQPGKDPLPRDILDVVQSVVADAFRD